MSAQTELRKLLEAADIRVGGDRPQDISVLDDSIYSRVLAAGTLGMGEGYMDGMWEANQLDQLVAHAVNLEIGDSIYRKTLFWPWLLAKFKNLQSITRAFQVAEHHYDDRGGVYEAMLGTDNMTYTCGYFNGKEKTLEQAQFDKHELICQKLGIKAGDRVLDIGCGFGEFAKHAAKEHGAFVTGVTISEGQLKVARQRTQGLTVEYLLQDYRYLSGEPFDHIVSIGMFEAVGDKNFREFMEVARRMLKPTGLFLLHTIGTNLTFKHGDPWLDKYIFRNGKLPSASEFSKSHEALFVMEDWHNFGADYDKTLMEWFRRFDAWWQDDYRPGYDAEFYRMWKFYLLSCAGLFRARKVQLWQVVLSPNGVPGGYTSVR